MFFEQWLFSQRAWQVNEENLVGGPLLISRLERAVENFTISSEMIYWLRWRENLLKSSFITTRTSRVIAVCDIYRIFPARHIVQGAFFSQRDTHDENNTHVRSIWTIWLYAEQIYLRLGSFLTGKNKNEKNQKPFSKTHWKNILFPHKRV